MSATLNNSLGKFADDKAVQSNFLQTAVAVTLTPNQNVVRAVGQAAGIAITLPPVGDCAGRTFAISSADSGTNNVTVQDQNDSQGWVDQVLDGVETGVLLYCDGIRFWVLTADLT